MKKGMVLCISILTAGMWLFGGGMRAAMSQGVGSEPIGPDELASIESAGGFSGAEIVIEQVITGNTLDEVNANYSAEIVNSGDGTTGLVLINQAPGNINNQANVMVASLNTELDDILSEIQLGVSSVEADNDIINSTGERTARIHNSFNNGSGIVQINQAAGSLNNQLNLVAVVVGETFTLPEPLVMPGMVPLSEMELGNVSGANDAVDADGESLNQASGITESFENFQGIVQVNQTEGNRNTIQMQTLVSVEIVRLK